MSIFGKKQKLRNCDVCDALYVADDGPPHEYSHVIRISSAEPLWLPQDDRQAAEGQYTFRCDRCNSFPSTKWPSEGGAYFGMNVHLAASHDTGKLGGSGRGYGKPVNFDMIPAD